MEGGGVFVGSRGGREASKLPLPLGLLRTARRTLRVRCEGGMVPHRVVEGCFAIIGGGRTEGEL